MSARIDRRRFLKKAGLTSVALGSLPALVGTLPALADGEMGFHFVTVSGAGPDLLVMAGAGKFEESDIEGGGNFVHIVAATGGLVGAGTWKAGRVISFKSAGSFHGFSAGVLDADVTLRPEAGGEVPARLRVVCNIGFAKLFTGQPEGVSLTVGGATFKPLPEIQGRPFGLTVFTTGSNGD